MENDLLNILIVDDNEQDLFIIKRKIASCFPKATFTTARSFEEFKERLKWISPDLVVSDYDLRGATGLDVLLHLHKTNPDTPFIFVTGMLNNDSQTAQAILSGASGFILKDDLDDLPETLRMIMSKVSFNRASRQSKLDMITSCQLKLQQLGAYLEKSVSFDKQEYCLKLLREIEDHLNHVK